MLKRGVNKLHSWYKTKNLNYARTITLSKLNQSFRCFSNIEGNSTNKCIYAFSFLVGKHREPQSINAKLFLPIIPFDIVAYAFTLLWDNLSRNSCIQNVVFYSFRVGSPRISQDHFFRPRFSFASRTTD